LAMVSGADIQRTAASLYAFVLPPNQIFVEGYQTGQIAERGQRVCRADFAAKLCRQGAKTLDAEAISQGAHPVR
jgi:hypothetical protein